MLGMALQSVIDFLGISWCRSCTCSHDLDGPLHSLKLLNRNLRLESSSSKLRLNLQQGLPLCSIIADNPAHGLQVEVGQLLNSFFAFPGALPAFQVPLGNEVALDSFSLPLPPRCVVVRLGLATGKLNAAILCGIFYEVHYHLSFGNARVYQFPHVLRRKFRKAYFHFFGSQPRRLGRRLRWSCVI